MGQTLSEKIISEHAGGDFHTGQTVVVKVDYTFTHDASGPLTITKLKDLGLRPKDPKRTIFFIDHAVPSPRLETSNDQAKIRSYVQETGCEFSDSGGGICHQVIAEKYASPGNIIVGTDSHTVMAGALGAFATGMGASDVAVAMALGKTWLRIPETHRVYLDSPLPRGVYSKDVILSIIGMLGADGGNYKSLDFMGPGVDVMPMHERLTLSNMVVEAGAKSGLIPTDEKTREYLKQMGREDCYRRIQPDADAEYERTITIEGQKLVPVVAFPHSVDNVKRIDEIGDEKIDIVFMGSCTNSRLEDLHVAAGIIKDRKLKTRLIVTPASRTVYEQAIHDGTMEILLKAGAVITPAGCGMCFGALGGIPADGERVLTTTNRNFQGRTGNPKAFTYLASPATAAATAVEGRIADPRDLL